MRQIELDGHFAKPGEGLFRDDGGDRNQASVKDLHRLLTLGRAFAVQESVVDANGPAFELPNGMRGRQRRNRFGRRIGGNRGRRGQQRGGKGRNDPSRNGHNSLRSVRAFGQIVAVEG
ncbi:hypothetical protein IPV69_25720 [Humisphaera borealis]|uniref:Uncharacterized protein n=1 Tax=Humisphaera borealis TaxID=2807512 RepID=A0A7M2WYF2_9BACT|nr:hypothetical protein IPV69_25720 [Humisphaera borealis]